MAEKKVFRIISTRCEFNYRDYNNPPELDDIISECLNLNSSYTIEFEMESETEAYNKLKELSKYNDTYVSFKESAKRSYSGYGYTNYFEMYLLNEIIVDNDGDEIEFISEDYYYTSTIRDFIVLHNIDTKNIDIQPESGVAMDIPITENNLNLEYCEYSESDGLYTFYV